MPEKTYPIGLDLGNGGTKIVSEFGEHLMDSYISYPAVPYPQPGKGYVKYNSGTREDLAGKYWLTGIHAYYADPTKLVRSVDSPTGKIDLALQLILGVLSTWEYRSMFRLKIAASVQDGPVFAKQLRQMIQGEHEVEFGGKISKVALEVETILEEGVGAAISLVLGKEIPTENYSIFDFGNGTTMCTAFSGMNSHFREYNVHNGVESLYYAIAHSPEIRSLLLCPADQHLIRKGVETGDFLYGNTGHNFSQIYKKYFVKYFNDSLSPFVRTMAARNAGQTALVAIGGGTLLPGIQGALQGKGFYVPKNPRWINANGLFLSVRGAK